MRTEIKASLPYGCIATAVLVLCCVGFPGPRELSTAEAAQINLAKRAEAARIELANWAKPTYECRNCGVTFSAAVESGNPRGYTADDGDRLGANWILVSHSKPY